MKVTAQQFEKISIRGCVAYGICCLENALEHYNIKGEGWNFLLKKLWWYTELSAASDPSINNCLPLERWAYLTTMISPYILKEENNYDVFSQKEKWWHEDNIPTEEEYNLLKNTYKDSNGIIDLLCKHLHQVGVCELWGGILKTSPYTLMHLQKLIDVMHEQQIPLPSIEPFKQYVFHKEGWDYDLHGFGEMFDGTQYSKFVNSTK